jgi:4-hydroxy-tetrahydrodipicolinate synthase
MQLRGVYAPIVTPFDAREEIDFDVLKRLIDFVLANGVVGLIPGGTTGEVYALNDAERLEVFRFVKDYVGSRATLIAGVNAGATRDAVRFAQAAEGLGYDGLMAAVPPYSRPSQRELLAHFKTVAAASALPIVLYNFPWRAGSEISYDILDGLAVHDNVIGIKEASSDMSRVYEMRMRYGDRFQISCGSDDQALDYFLWGSTSWIGGAASCAPRQHVGVLDAALAGDFPTARARMEKLMPLLRNMESGHYTQKVKAGCELQGIPVGPARRPLLPLTPEYLASFAEIFRAAVA